ncbi:hypothetical protein BGZ47_002687, partial [Haplosporangium gracile]
LGNTKWRIEQERHNHNIHNNRQNSKIIVLQEFMSAWSSPTLRRSSSSRLSALTQNQNWRVLSQSPSILTTITFRKSSLSDMSSFSTDLSHTSDQQQKSQS